VGNCSTAFLNVELDTTFLVKTEEEVEKVAKFYNPLFDEADEK
jgi:hypothetical protein